MKNNLISAIPYAQMLAQKGISLKLTNASHLSQGLTFSRPDSPKPFTTVSEFIDGVTSVIQMEQGVTEHQVFISNMVDEIAEPVKNHVAVARQIGALTSEFESKVRNYAAEASDQTAVGSFDIVKDELGPLFDISIVQNDVERAPKRLIGYNTATVCAGPRTEEELRGYLYTKNTDYNEAVDATLSFYGDNFLTNIWMGMFCNVSGVETPYHVANLANLPLAERLTVCYIAWLIANHIHGEVPPDAVGNMTQFQSVTSELSQFLHAQVGYCGDKMLGYGSDKMVVVRYEPSVRRIVVNGPNYRKWLEQGGQPEIVLGCCLTGATAYDSEALNYNRETALRAWNGYVMFHNQEADVRAAELLRSLYISCMLEQMQSVQPYEEQYRKDNPGHAEMVIDKTTKIVRSKSITQLKDFSKMSLELVAGLRFCYTPSLLILSEIDEILRSNPEADPREAALVASASYIAEYLLGQITKTAK